MTLNPELHSSKHLQHQQFSIYFHYRKDLGTGSQHYKTPHKRFANPHDRSLPYDPSSPQSALFIIWAQPIIRAPYRIRINHGATKTESANIKCQLKPAQTRLADEPHGRRRPCGGPLTIPSAVGHPASLTLLVSLVEMPRAHIVTDLAC